jgi:hypothetical protein
VASLTIRSRSRTIVLEPISYLRDMRFRRLLPVVTGVLIVCGAGRTLAQSLGDVAKKEEERRKHVQSAGKVYTNRDLGSAPPPSTPAAPAAGEDKSVSTASTPDGSKDSKDAKDDKSAKDAKASTPAEDAKGPAYWSAKRRTLQDTLDRDLTFADALQSRINALATDFVNRDDPAQRAVIERDRQKAVAELERLRKQIADDRKAIADFEEEARRAGVPPGWLR